MNSRDNCRSNHLFVWLRANINVFILPFDNFKTNGKTVKILKNQQNSSMFSRSNRLEIVHGGKHYNKCLPHDSVLNISLRVSGLSLNGDRDQCIGD